LHRFLEHMESQHWWWRNMNSLEDIADMKEHHQLSNSPQYMLRE